MFSKTNQFFAPIIRNVATMNGALERLTTFQSLPGYFAAVRFGITPSVITEHEHAKLDALKPLYKDQNVWTVLTRIGTRKDELLAADVKTIEEYSQYILTAPSETPLSITAFNALNKYDKASLLNKTTDKHEEYLAFVN